LYAWNRAPLTARFYRIAILEIWRRTGTIASFNSFGAAAERITRREEFSHGRLFDPALSRGFAHIVSTQNVMQQHCNDALRARR